MYNNDDVTQPHSTPLTPPRKPGFWGWFGRQRLAARIMLVIGTLLLSTCACCSAFTAWGATLPPAPTNNSAAAPTTTKQQTKTTIAQVVATPTQVKPTATPSPTPSPTATPKPKLTATPSPKPTQPPPAKPKPTSPPAKTKPTQPPPPPTGVNGNPWGYNFDPGAVIYSPPSAFCDYFACIGNFWNGKGYVMECSDGAYSKSGGVRGSCSQHGGNWRALYSH